MKQGIIIGASSGIGWELAVQLAAKGYQLGLMARRIERLEQLADSLSGEHLIQGTDLRDAEQAEQDLHALLDRMGNVELIVVNSGVGIRERKLDWVSEKQMIDVNVRGFAVMSVTAMNYFQQRGAGHLVGVSSVASHATGGLMLTYTASKAFVSNYLEGMRSRARHSGLPITVTTVEPGFVKTPMVDWDAFWMAPVDKAVAQMVKAISKQKNHVYITKRWRLAVWILELTPNWLMRKFG
jgi:short-subunit dehydrogenase